MRMTKRTLVAPLLAMTVALSLAPAALALESDDADISALIQPFEQLETLTTPLPIEVITAPLSAPPSTAKGSVCRLYVGGKFVPVNPYYQGSTLMVPLRVLAEKTGYNYEYRKGAISMFGGGKSFSLKIGQNKYPVGSKSRAYEYAPVLVDNYTYVPWLYLEQGLGMKVTIAPDGRIDVKLPTLRNPLRVNGKGVVSYSPYYSGKTLMLPLRAVAEKLGYSYYFDNKARFSAFAKDGIETRVFWGKKVATQGAATISLDKAATLKNSSLFVPKSFIERMFAAKVVVEKTGSINVKTK